MAEASAGQASFGWPSDGTAPIAKSGATRRARPSSRRQPTRAPEPQGIRSVLFGSVRRVRPEDLEAYEQSLNASRPPADEDWCTVADLMRAARVSRSQAYRLLARGMVPFRVFAGVRRIRREDITMFVGPDETGDSPDGTA